jgi:heme oxygenase (mycobilin-producing)
MSFVVTSDVRVPEDGADVLQAAFADRLRLVERHDGFQRLEVWRDERDPGAFVMVSWWDDEQAFRAYMRSVDHRVSHARVPSEPARPRAAGVRRFRRVSD